MKTAVSIALIIAGAILCIWGFRDLFTETLMTGASQFAGASAMFMAAILVRLTWPD